MGRFTKSCGEPTGLHFMGVMDRVSKTSKIKLCRLTAELSSKQTAEGGTSAAC